MITRGDILMLGLYSSVSGSLIGGLMLGIGMNLAAQGVNVGWLLIVPAAPCSAIIGWILAKRLAKQLKT